MQMPYRTPSRRRPALLAKWRAEARLRDAISRGLPTEHARQSLKAAAAAERRTR
jgi:hypothetical protein